MIFSLGQIFVLLDKETPPEKLAPADEVADNAIIASLYSVEGFDLTCLPGTAQRLFELSVNAFDAIVHAWMSGFPIEREILAFGCRVLASGSRHTADCAASDRGDPAVLVVLQAAYKTGHEIDRMRGLLRFSQNEQGVYVARCEPDHYILPALEAHFTLRFGDTPWAIIDEKRGISVGRPRPVPANTAAAEDPWESLWKHYHQTINNESRNNPELQRRFMPQRYHKYLPEMEE